jgi:hypothetical protein
MKIQGSRFVAIISALTLMITGLVGTQPASAALTTPTWNSGGEPAGFISGSFLTVSSLPSVNTSVNHGTVFPRVFACLTAVPSAGFVSWAAPVGQPLMPPSGDRSDCVELGVATLGSFDIAGSGVLGGSSYDPATHGVEIMIGARFSDNNGTVGNNADDASWLAFGASMTYTPPTPLTATSASVDATGLEITVTLSEGISGPSMQTFVLTVDGSPKAPQVRSIFPGDTTVTLAFLLPHDAVGAGSVVTLDYLGGSGGQTRIRANANPSNQLANFSGMSVTNNSTVGGGSSPSQTVSTPYTGPVLQAPGAVAAVAQGSKVVIPGSNLSGVSKVEIGGVDAKVVVNSAGELEITVPTGLAAGTYDLVVTSDSGKLTVQDGIRVSGSATTVAESIARPSVKKDTESNTVKVRVFDVIGAGKVQIFVNGKEVAWINAADANDPKLFGEYLVRTIELKSGKNAIEVFVNGVRSDRWAFTG